MDASGPVWRKSSRSFANGNCVRVASRCQNRECVAVGSAHGVILVGDSKNPGQPPLVLSPGVWRAFTASIKAEG